MIRREKLVRDKIQELSKAESDGREFRIAAQGERTALVAAKVLEEAQELANEILDPVANRQKITEEIADCLEVIRAAGALFQIEPGEVLACMEQKTQKKGAFTNWLVLDLGTNIKRP